MPYARIKAKYRNSGNNFSTFQFNPSGSHSTLNKLLEDFNNSIEENIIKIIVIFFHNSIEEIIKTCSTHYSSEFQKCSLILKTDFLKKRYTEGVFLFLYRQGTVRHNSQYQHRSKIKDKENNVHFQEKELLLSEQFFFSLLSGTEKAVRTRCSKSTFTYNFKTILST